MEQFQRQDQTTRRPVEVQILEPVLTGERWDDYREVRLVIDGGRQYQAIFWRDPMGRGGHWWEEPGMVIVQDLTTEQVLAAVDEVLRCGAIDEAFEPLAGE